MLGGVICQMFFGIILIAVYRALYAGKPQDYPFTQIASYVWLQQAFFRMLLASDPDLLDKIRTGGIAYDLCRPLSLYGFYYVRILAQKMMGSLLRAAPMLVFALLLPEGWGLSAPASAAGFCWALAGLLLGLLCVSAMENITMGFTMRTLDSRGMQGLLNLLMMILAGNILPLTLFPDSWQKAITLLPYAQMLDAPLDPDSDRNRNVFLAPEPEADCHTGRLTHGYDQTLSAFHADADPEPASVSCFLFYADAGAAGHGRRGNAGGNPAGGPV